MSRGRNCPAPILQSPGNIRAPAITNSRGNLPGWKAHRARTPEAKATALRLMRFRRVRKALLKDQTDDPTEAQQILATDAAGLAVWVEEQIVVLSDRKLEHADINQLNATINTLRRLLETLGIQRVHMKDITPTLSEYLKQKPQPQPPTINGSANEATDNS
jgi:hypothetical protein